MAVRKFHKNVAKLLPLSTLWAAHAFATDNAIHAGSCATTTSNEQTIAFQYGIGSHYIYNITANQICGFNVVSVGYNPTVYTFTPPSNITSLYSQYYASYVANGHSENFGVTYHTSALDSGGHNMTAVDVLNPGGTDENNLSNDIINWAPNQNVPLGYSSFANYQDVVVVVFKDGTAISMSKNAATGRFVHVANSAYDTEGHHLPEGPTTGNWTFNNQGDFYNFLTLLHNYGVTVTGQTSYTPNVIIGCINLNCNGT